MVPMMTGLAGEFLAEASSATTLSSEGWVLRSMDDIRTKVIRPGWDLAAGLSVLASPRSVLRSCLVKPPFGPLSAIVEKMAPHHREEVQLMQAAVLVDFAGVRSQLRMLMRDDPLHDASGDWIFDMLARGAGAIRPCGS